MTLGTIQSPAPSHHPQAAPRPPVLCTPSLGLRLVDRARRGPAGAGDEVDVVSHEGQFIARGLYNPASTIRVRLYRWDDGPLDEAFWSGLIAAAVRLRHEMLGLGRDQSAYRLIFSEGDGLSGLTVDRYDRWLVAQFTSLALYTRRDLILRLLAEAPGPRDHRANRARHRPERGPAGRRGNDVGSVPDEPVEIVENGLTYRVDLRAGQKTGFYLDQRINRRAAAAYCRGQTGAGPLLLFRRLLAECGPHGAAAGALGVDSSAAAIELARQHAAINGLDRAQFKTATCSRSWSASEASRRRFDVVICDPPKFARQAKDVEQALKGYLRLNLAALDVLEPDGVLVTCSCSGLIGRELFADLIASVAEQSGRPIQILEQRGQAPDHPVSASCLETEYLKCLICRVGG